MSDSLALCSDVTRQFDMSPAANPSWPSVVRLIDFGPDCIF
jgi:hypothetical protein